MKTRCGLACLSSLSRLNYAEQQLLLCSKLFRHCTAPPVGFLPLLFSFFLHILPLTNQNCGIALGRTATGIITSDVSDSLIVNPDRLCLLSSPVFFLFFLDWGHYLYYLWSHPSDKDRNEFFPTELINFLSAWWSPVVMHGGWRSLALSPTIIDLNWQLLQRVCHC